MMLIASGLGLKGTMGLEEWAIVALACAIIMGLLGPRLLKDIQGWFVKGD